MAVVVAAVGDEHHGSTVRANVEPTVACVHSRHVATAKVEVMESQATQTLVVHALKQTMEASAKAQPAAREEKKITPPTASSSGRTAAAMGRGVVPRSDGGVRDSGWQACRHLAWWRRGLGRRAGRGPPLQERRARAGFDGEAGWCSKDPAPRERRLLGSGRGVPSGYVAVVDDPPRRASPPPSPQEAARAGCKQK